MRRGSPFTVLWSVPPWWLRDYPLVMEPGIEIGRGPSLGQAQTVMAPAWQGPTALVLGPSSWGFSVGSWPGTAYAPPPEWPAQVPLLTKRGPYGL